MDRLERPFTEDVIDDTFHTIETTPELRNRYDALCAVRGQVVVNTWGGWWIGRTVERRGLREVKTQKSTLIGQYSKLDRPVPPKKNAGKVKADVAGIEVFRYYSAHKTELPHRDELSTMRDEITAMVADGTPVAEAFEVAVQLLSSR
ncbi:MAG TPA: hypothetical protein VGE20_19635 [Ramlibacter sp.]